MSKVAQIESELEKLSQAELRQIRDWLDNIIEDYRRHFSLCHCLIPPIGSFSTAARCDILSIPIKVSESWKPG